jgi:fido (protein-threonine AMPylation protein)
MNHAPWYTNCRDRIREANRRIGQGLRVKRGPDKKICDHEADNYLIDTIIGLIFESNRLEDAGLSEGETKKLIVDSKVLEALRKYYESWPERELESEWDKAIDKAKWTKKEKWSRSSREVSLHASALIIPLAQAQLFHELKSKPQPDLVNRLFDETSVKAMHTVLMDGLIPEEWEGLESGQYRNGPCHADHRAFFTDWRNIPNAVAEWTLRSNARMRSDESPIAKAARISYEFVAIHPFPDGNGRMSRIILNMVLRAEGLPFMAVLSGNKKEKHRYIVALRHANRGNLESYECLIAIAVNKGFDELKDKLKLAGVDPANLKI